ncbi:MAG: GIY-YIG nuclease family protein [Armatimonadota bacterium]
MSTSARPSRSIIVDSQKRIRDVSRKLPEHPGIYLMEDERGTIIYIGKAVNLKRRVGSYANPSAARDKKTARLVSNFNSLSFVETSSELEALLIEARMIKAKLPAFNRKLIEPESYCYLRTDFRDECSRIDYVTRWSDDGADYLGPLWDTSAVREALEGISNVFKLRRCTDNTRKRSKELPCMLYEIEKCAGPCSRISISDYRLALRFAWDSFAGKSDTALRKLTALRQRLADEYRFEAAHTVHRQIRALEIVSSANQLQPASNSDFAVVTHSHLPGRPVILLFKDGRLGDKLLAAPRVYPDAEMIGRRLTRLQSSGRDLLPGKPCSDDLLIVRSYIRQHNQTNKYIPIPQDILNSDAALSIHSSIDALRHN